MQSVSALRASSPDSSFVIGVNLSAAEAFRKYYFENDLIGRKPEDKEALELARLSVRCTRAYEDALASAGEGLERATICSEWRDYRTRPWFTCEGEALRVMRLPAGDTDASSDAIERQSMLLRRVFRGGLDVNARLRTWPAERKEALADCLAAEFGSFAAVGIPDGQFAKMIGDMPVFAALLLPDTTMTDSGDQYRNTIRWYLWNAIICELPDEIERAAIDTQVRQLADAMTAQLDVTMASPKIKPEGAQRAQEFLKTYEIVKDNVFCPYFKRMSFSYETEIALSEMNECYAQIARSWSASCAEYDKIEDKVLRNAKYEETWQYLVTAVRQVNCHAAVRNARPAGFTRMPYEWIQLSTGDLNADGFYVFAVQTTMPYDGSGAEQTFLRNVKRVEDLGEKETP